MKKSNLALLALSAVLASLAGSVCASDLLSVYRDALSYDAQFGAARAALEAGREKLPQGRAGLLPTLGVGASTIWNDVDTTVRSLPPTTNTKYNTNGWTLTLTQPIFRYQNWVAYSQSELAVTQAEAQFEAARMDVMVRSAQAYFDVLLATDALATAQAQKIATAEQLESAKRNFEVGTSTITDTHEAQARYDLIVAQEIAAQNDLTVKRNALATLIGKDVESLKPLKAGVIVAPPEPLDMNKWVEMADSGSPAIHVAQAGFEIAGREVDRQRGGHYPTVDLVATRSYGAQTSTGIASGIPGGAGIETNTSTVGLQLSMPLFAGGYTSSKQREAVALKEKAQADLDYARRSTQLAVRQAYLGVTSGLSQVKAYEAALTSSQSSLDSNKLGYEVGVRINIDVLNAQSQLYDTRQKLAKARLDTIAALLKLKATVGNLSEKDIESVNALLGD